MLEEGEHPPAKALKMGPMLMTLPPLIYLIFRISCRKHEHSHLLIFSVCLVKAFPSAKCRSVLVANATGMEFLHLRKSLKVLLLRKRSLMMATPPRVHPHLPLCLNTLRVPDGALETCGSLTASLMSFRCSHPGVCFVLDRPCCMKR